MATVTIVVPSAQDLEVQTRITLTQMIRESQCQCGGHLPWDCPNGLHDIVWMPPVGSSIVHWTRNQLIAFALYGPYPKQRPPSEYILMVDDDMTMEPWYLKRLMSHKKDIVAGICTVRRDPPIPNIRVWDKEIGKFRDCMTWDWDTQKLLEVDGVGGAFVLVRRKVFERMAEAYLSCQFEIDEDLRKGYPEDKVRDYWARKSVLRRARFEGETDWKKKDCWWFQFLDNYVDTQLGEIGEDLSFSLKCKALGYRIFCDPQVRPGHLGFYAYSIDDHIAWVEDAKRNGKRIVETDYPPQLGPTLVTEEESKVEV